jgi:tetratricopeptide (TPR) repeat protein
MSAVITCPKCRTRLKLSKVPTESTKLQCPHCQHPFSVSANAVAGGVTAKPPAPALAPSSKTSTEPLARPVAATSPKGRDVDRSKPRRDAAPGKAPLIGTGMGTAIVLTIIAVGSGVVAMMYMFNNTPAKSGDGQDPVALQDPTKSKSDAEDKDKIRSDRLELARGYERKKHFKLARDEYDEILRLFPKDNDAQLGKERVLEQIQLIEATRNAPPKSNQEAENAQKTAKENKEKLEAEVASLIKQGKDAYDTKQLATADGYFSTALEKDPGNDEATRWRVVVREALVQADLERRFTALFESAKSSLAGGRYPDAIRDAVAAQQVSPTNATWVGEAYKVQQAAEQQLTMIKGQDERGQAFAKIMEQGTSALRDRRFPEAVEAFKVALKLVPGDPTASKGLADAEAGAQQLIAELSAAQNQYQMFMTQGKQAMAGGFFDVAVNNFNQASLLMPADAEARAALINAQSALSRVAAYRTAMENGRNAMVQKQYAAAMMAYSDALLNMPTDPFALQGRIDAQQLLLGQIQTKQIVDFKLAQAGELLKAKVPLKNKQFLAARDLLIDAARIMPDHPNILLTNNLALYTDAMAKGQVALGTGRFGEAIDAFLNSEATLPNDPSALEGLKNSMILGSKIFLDSMAKGKQAIDGKNYPEAVARFTDAVIATPENPLANAKYPEERFPEARAAALQGLADAQQLGKARYDEDMIRGKQAVDARNYNEAVARYSDALRIIPNDPQALQGLNDAQKLQQTARDFDGKVQQAKQYLKQQRYNDARDVFRSLIQVAPTQPQAQAMTDQASYADAMGRGQSALIAKNFPDAVAAYSEALRVFPKDGPATQGLSDAQRQITGNLAGNFADKVKQGDQSLALKQYADAAKFYNDALALQPGNPQVKSKANYAAAMVQGQNSLAAKSYADALNAFNVALAAMPKDASALAGQQEAQRQLQNVGAAQAFDAKVKQGDQSLGLQQYADAAKSYSDALKLQPGNVPVQTKVNFATAMIQAQTAMKAGKYADAVTAYNVALAQINNDPAALQGLQNATRLSNAGQELNNKLAKGTTALQQQKYFEASKAFNEAIALLQPGDPQAKVLAAKVQYADAMANARGAMENKNFAGAATFYQTALAAQANDPLATQGLQEAQRLGQVGQARQDFDNKVAQGNAFLTQKNYVEASKSFNAAVKALPFGDKHAVSAQKLANFADAMAGGYSAISQNNLPAAINYFTTATRTAPLGDTTAQAALQDVTQRQAQAQAAAAAATAAQNRKDFDSKVSLANTLITQQRYGEAHQTLEGALKLIPDAQVQKTANYAHAMSKGNAAVTKKNFKEAAREFQIALDNRPNDPAAMTALASVKKK